MADNLVPVGVRATVADVEQFLRNADLVNRATAGMGKAAEQAAGQTTGAAAAQKQFTSEAEKGKGALDGLTSRIGQVSSGVAGLVAKLAPVGAAIAGAFAIGKGIHEVQELGSELYKLKSQTNLSAEEASKLGFAFEEAGVPIGLAERSLIKFSRALGGVADLEDGIAIPTGKKMADQLFAFGIRTEDAEGKTRPLTDVISDLADVFQKMPDGIEKTSLATNIFGRSGKDLIPFLNQGKDGMHELFEEADKLGLVLDGPTLDAIHHNEIEMRHFHAALRGISVQIGLAFLPALVLLTKVGVQAAVAFNQKVVPALKLFGAIGNFVFRQAVVNFAPDLLLLARRVQSFVFGLRAAFATGFKFESVNAAVAVLNQRLNPLTRVIAALGAAVKLSLVQFRTMYEVMRIVSAIIGAVLHDFTNFDRILQLFPRPVRVVVGAIEEVVKAVVSLGREIIALVVDPFQRLFDRANELSRRSGLGGLSELLDKLGRFIVPTLATAMTLLISSLAVGVVLGFASAIGNLVSAFGGLSVVKFVTGLIIDFAKALTAPFQLVFDLVGNGVKLLGDILEGLAGLAGRAITVTIDAVGTAIDFVKGFVSGALQQLLDVSPGLKVKVEPTVTLGAEATASAEQASGGLAKRIGEIFQSAFSGAIGGFFGALVEENAFGEFFIRIFKPLAILAPLLLPFRIAGASLGAVFADGFLVGAARISVIGALIIGAIEEAIDLTRGKFREAGFRGGFALGGGIIGGIIGSIVPGAGTVAGAAVGTAIGIAIADALIFIFGGKVIDAFADFFGRTLPQFIRRLPRTLGFALGYYVGLQIAELTALLILLPAFIIRELRKGITKAIPEIIELGRTIVEGLIRGIEAAVSAVPKIGEAIANAILATGPLLARAFRYVFDPRRLLGDVFDQIVKTIADPTRIIRGVIILAAAVARAVRTSFRIVADAFEDIGRTIAEIFQFGPIAAIVNIVKTILRGVLAVVEEFGKAFVEGISEAIADANEATGGGFQKIGERIAQAFGVIRDIVTFAMAGIRDIIVGGWQLIVGAVDGVVGGFGGIASRVFGGLVSGIKSALREAGVLVVQFLQAVKSGLDAIPGGDPFGNDIQAAIDAIQALIGQVGNAGGGLNNIPLGGPGDGYNPNEHGLNFASGTGGPLRRTVMANVAEEGGELALLGRGRGIFPAGTEILSAPLSARLLSVLQNLPALAVGAAGGGGVTVAVTVPISSAMGFEEVRGIVHQEVDRQLLNSRSAIQRSGAPTTSSIG